MEFFIATKNNGKIKEFERIFKRLNIKIVTENDLDKLLPDIEENGKSFCENALIKARAGAAFMGLPTVADDSGLCVDALGGKPGILSARYSGKHGDSTANNSKLLSELKGIPLERRSAHFICAIACVFPDGREFTVSGRCDGFIDYSESGKGGFGYDPLFISEKGKFSEIDEVEKDSVSHRGKALREFEKQIKEYMLC